MAVTRAAVAAYLTDAYDTLLVDYGIPAEDAPGALRAPINRALMRLGVTLSDVDAPDVDDADGESACVLASYYLLQIMQGKTAARNVNVSMGDPNTSKGNDARARNLKDAMDAVLAEMVRLGVSGAGGWYAASIGLDFLEPEAC